MHALWPSRFSVRKFEHAGQINWLTIRRPDFYHGCIKSVADPRHRMPEVNNDNDTQCVRMWSGRFRLVAGALQFLFWPLF
ncbi:hypothetical protein FJW02_19365 [Pantoea eucalypti]|uniref:Uncharacterized protein n=1 Tax=Pantoea eucalypti TaxID=470933 RepID=A0ABY2ZCL3_9GAMM|nr:hypothetical protein FJW02_19365 [Pantoea eucalypti]